MTKECLVSIIIPVFNGEGFIKNTIEAVLNQSYDNIEIIIVNDGSVDNTLTNIKALNNDSLIIIDQSNAGVSIARNNGLKKSTGEYVCFLDADDLLPVSFVEDRVKFLNENRDFSFCCSDYIAIDKEGNELERGGFKLFTTDAVNEILLYSPAACSTPSSFMFLGAFLRKNNIQFHPQLSNTADRLFILDCFKYGYGAYFEGSPFYHTIYTGSMSSTISQKILFDFKLYLSLLISRNYIPQNIEKKCLKLNYKILCGITIKMRYYMESMKYFMMYISK
jgi:glycosyltransferase involved in cell wall biosynthesis